jgi:glycosyltransferase involved in cell wall biosynthesis
LSEIVIGCSSGFGHGGLGKHLEFVYRSAVEAGKSVDVYCRQAAGSEYKDVPNPAWGRWVPYTPLRWLPSLHVYESGIQFDREVEKRLPNKSVVYHGFPGFAERTFRKVRANGGINVLEAATTHVNDLFRDVSEEHKKFKMGGSPFSRGWVRRVLREYELADYITVASTLQKESFLRHGVSESKLLLAPLGVDTGKFSPLERRGGDDDRERGSPFRIIQLGQVSLLKGFPYLLEALEQLGDPEIELILYGGVGWRAIRKRIEQSRSRGVLIRTGAGDPVPVLREADACVHCSITDGFGLAPVEAMAVGLPTIVTDGTGMKDLIQDGVNGRIIPIRNPSALAECIAELKHNRDHRLRMGAEARKSALEYDVKLRTKQYGDLMKPVWERLGS